MLSLVVPVVHGRPRNQPFFERLLVLLFTFAPAFIILSLSYEALFFAVLCTTLVLWMLLECKLAEGRTDKTTTPINAQHLRIALFFLAFLHVCFFGVGNVASISSVSATMWALAPQLTLVRLQFYLEPVYRLIPVFAPFPMVRLALAEL